jgi:prepilin-type N-terminal cleavage/methylation domain-containing protein
MKKAITRKIGYLNRTFGGDQRVSVGLTLIELLVVIGIIAILASIIFVSTNMGRQKARDTKRLSDIQAIILALDQYVEANTVYPGAIADLHPQYLSAVPQDPISGTGYRYGKCISTGGSAHACSFGSGFGRYHFKLSSK